jgi:hypothetical protein
VKRTTSPPRTANINRYRAHEQFAVGFDAYNLVLRDDTAPKEHGLQADDTVRDLPVETVGCLGSVPIGHVVDDAQQIIDGTLGPRDGERSVHGDPRRSARWTVTRSSTDAGSWSVQSGGPVRPARSA